MFHKFRRYLSPTALQNEELNINHIFKPFYITLTLFGLLPYSVSYNQSKKRYHVIGNSIFINIFCAGFYSTFMSVFCIIHIKHLFHSEGHDSTTDAFISQLNYLLEIGTLVVYCVITYISIYMNRYKYVRILNSVCAIWCNPRNVYQNEILARLRFKVNVVAIGSIIAVAIVHLCVNLSRDESLWKKFLVICTGVVPSLIQTTVLAFHYILVMMVVAILEDINQELLMLTLQRKSTEHINTEVDMTREMKLPLTRLEHIYTKAYGITCDINEAFQPSLLFSTLQCFHCIISNAYVIYHGAMELTATPKIIMNCLFWIILQLCKVYSLSYSGKQLNDEATKIGQALHAIPIEKYDYRSFMEIQHFATMMNFQGFVLTVYGYFSLSAALMFGMVANVTMYLIILIQFDKSDK